MSSLNSALSVAVSGLKASTQAAQTISGNISNANTAGYTEKTVTLEAISSGPSLGGVQITGTTRSTNAVLTTTLNNATTSAAYYSTQNSYLSQVQSILDSTDDPPALSAAVSGFQSAWTQYSASPSDITLQKTVVTSGETLASTINTIATQTSTLKTNVESDLSTSVNTLNSYLSQVQTLNSQIVTAGTDGEPTVDLQDQRDTLVNKIAQYTNVTVMQRPNGQIALYTSSGTPLLDNTAQKFSVSNNGLSILNSLGADVSTSLSGGSLQAQTDFLSTSNTTGNGVGVITKLQSQLQNYANLFVATTTNPATNTSFADVYNSSTTATGELSSGFFTATTDASTGLPDVTSFAVNTALVNGTKTAKVASATAMANLFTTTNTSIDMSAAPTTVATSNTFTASGLTTTNQTYSGLSTQILSGFQQAANDIKSQNTTAAAQQTYYQNTLSGDLGVNTDSELVNLTNWENSYAASAHVITTIQSMMTTLINMVN